MAGTIYVDASLRDPRGNVVTLGRILTGVNDIITAGSFGMRTLKSVVFSPWAQSQVGGRQFTPGSIGSQPTKLYQRRFGETQGSIGSLGQLNNYVRVVNFRVATLGSMTARPVGPQGTARLYIGTQAGSQRASYIAVGR